MYPSFTAKIAISRGRYSYVVAFFPFVCLFGRASAPVFGALRTDGFWIWPFHFYRVTWRMAVGETAVP